jgi:hypothetical protein
MNKIIFVVGLFTMIYCEEKKYINEDNNKINDSLSIEVHEKYDVFQDSIKVKNLIKEFYVSYGSLDYSIENHKKIDSLQKIYCTNKLNDKLFDIFNNSGMDYDIITNDELLNIESLKTLNVKVKDIKSGLYTVSFTTISYPISPTEPIEKKVSFDVKVLIDNGVLKIDEILNTF